jgi:hypothetical protein
MLVLFSSGISIFNRAHVGALEEFGKRNKFFRYVASMLLSIIAVTSKVRRAWIQIISPGKDSH